MFKSPNATAGLTCLAFFFATCELASGAGFDTFPRNTWGTADIAIDRDAQIALDRARDYYDALDSSAVFLTYRGRVLLDWGETERKFMCHSMRKSLLYSMIGIAVEQGSMRLDATMANLGIDDMDPLSDREKQATVLELLQCRSGIYHPAAYEAQAMKDARPERGSHLPGTHYYYNNWDFNALLTIYEQETGRRFFEAFRDAIAGPIGMEQFSLEDTEYHYERALSKHPAYPFKLTAKDLARYGTLYLNRGKWGDQQIIPSEWIAKETTAYSQVGGMEVGFKWRRPRYGILRDLGVFFTSGAFGHRVYVIQDLDMVFVHRVNTFDDGNEVGHYDIERLLKLILLGYENLLEESTLLHLKDETGSHRPVAIEPRTYSRFLGDYSRLIARVTLNDQSSHIELIGDVYQKVKLEPIDGKSGEYRVPNGRIRFSRGEGSEILGLTHHVENRDPPRAVFAQRIDGTEAFEGDYVYSRYHVSREGDQLYLRRDDRDKLELTPLSATEFFIDGVDSRFEFVFGEDGVVSGMLRHEESGVTEAKRIP